MRWKVEWWLLLGLRVGGIWGVAADGYGAFLGDENVLKQIFVMVAQFCEYAKSDRIVHFKWVNCM